MSCLVAMFGSNCSTGWLVADVAVIPVADIVERAAMPGCLSYCVCHVLL